jgi:nitroreductase
LEFKDVIRRRRMVRTFDQRPVPRDVIDRILDAGRRGPSAGFSQGFEFLVLDSPAQLAHFWATTHPWDSSSDREQPAAGPPLIILPLSDKQAYLARYSKPDKAGTGMHVEEGWPAPYWDLDTAMAAMLMLLAAVDEGLGGWLFGIFAGEDQLLNDLHVPAGLKPIGALGFGYAGPDERGGSARSLTRRPLEEQVHWGHW